MFSSCPSCPACPILSDRTNRCGGVSVFIKCCRLVLEDPRLLGRAPSTLGWVGSTVNQHCQLRLEALLGGLGEAWLGESG